MNLRDGLLIQKHAIGANDLQRLIDYVRSAAMTQSLVSNVEDEVEGDPDPTNVEWIVNKKVRDTQEVQLDDAIKKQLHDLVRASIGSTINPCYDVEVRDWEPIQILHYGPGGHYIPHVDADTLYKDEEDRDFWEKTLDRDLSIVYFLNDNFDGGDLVFPDFDLRIRPEAGTLVCFPSDHNYIHGVEPVTTGHRFTIVSWLRVVGMPALTQINQTALDEYHRVRPKRFEQPPFLTRGGGIRALKVSR